MSFYCPDLREPERTDWLRVSVYVAMFLGCAAFWTALIIGIWAVMG